MIYLYDIDHTLIRPASGGDFPERAIFVHDQEVLIDAVKSFPVDGTIVGLSNQAGIEMGYSTRKAMTKRFQHTLTLIPRLKCIYYVPNYAGSEIIQVTECGDIAFKAMPREDFRKPSPDSISFIQEMLGDRVVQHCGDREEDELLAANANIKFVPVQ